ARGMLRLKLPGLRLYLVEVGMGRVCGRGVIRSTGGSGGGHGSGAFPYDPTPFLLQFGEQLYLGGVPLRFEKTSIFHCLGRGKCPSHCHRCGYRKLLSMSLPKHASARRALLLWQPSQALAGRANTEVIRGTVLRSGMKG